MIMFIIYSQALSESVGKRDKKGQVSRMKNLKAKVSGRMAAHLAPVCVGLTGLAGLSGEAG
jgi:hypothetical protein